MDEAKAKTPDFSNLLHLPTIKHANYTSFLSERLGAEKAREFTPPVKRSSWACPFSDCDTVSKRLADHLVSKHNLKGAAWKPFRHRLLKISKDDDNLYQEEVDMLEQLVGKVEDFEVESIIIFGLFAAGL